MRKSIFSIILAVLLLPTLALAGGPSMTMLAGAGGGAACVSQTMGYTTGASGSTTGLAAGQTAAVVAPTITFAAPCDGTLSIGHIWSGSTNNASAKVCVYSDDGDGSPDGGDILVACSAAIATGGSVGDKTGNFASGQITSGVSYRIVVTVDDSSAAAWTISYTANTADYEPTDGTDCKDWFDIGTNDLSGTGLTDAPCVWGANLNRRLHAWVTVN